MAELLDRETHRDAVFARRAHEPRAHKVVSPATRAFLEVVVHHFLGGSGLPAELLDSLCESKAASTWDGYVGAARPWFTHAAAQGFPALPADPVRFACWLATTARTEHGYKPTKARCCAIAALSKLVGVASPGNDPRVQALRSLFVRTKTFRRGRSRPLLRADIPLVGADPAEPHSPRGSPSPRRRGRAGPSPQTKRRRRDATVAHMAVLHDAVLRHDDTREGQLGDLSFHPGAVDLGIFGSKTDALRVGQSAQMPSADEAAPDAASGARALLEVTRRGLARLAALEAPVFDAVARRLAERFPRDTAHPGAMATWPPYIRALAAPLYERGLLVHCLPYYGSWLWEPLSADSDLTATLPTQRFADLAREALRDAGVPTAGVAAHSLRRGGAAELLHGGMDILTLSRALRHVSVQSTSPYVFQSVHIAATAGAMRAAVRRSYRPPGRRPATALPLRHPADAGLLPPGPMARGRPAPGGRV